MFGNKLFIVWFCTFVVQSECESNNDVAVSHFVQLHFWNLISNDNFHRSSTIRVYFPQQAYRQWLHAMKRFL